MEATKHLIVDKSILSESLLNINNKISSLIQQNLLTIVEKNKIELELPITRATIYMLCIAYRFKIPVKTITALYQVYANDLLVIILTLLQSVDLIELIEVTYANVLENLQSYQHLQMTPEGEHIYKLLKVWKVDNSLFIPLNLW